MRISDCSSDVCSSDLNEWFGRTIIHSDRRFSYEEAQQVLDRGKGDYSTELKTLNNLAFLLREARFGNGAINFETTEVRSEERREGTEGESTCRTCWSR